jgi:hypothetical protein
MEGKPMKNGMQVTVETPQGGVTATVTSGRIGSARVEPDGTVSISFIPIIEPDQAEEAQERTINGFVSGE